MVAFLAECLSKHRGQDWGQPTAATLRLPGVAGAEGLLYAQLERDGTLRTGGGHALTSAASLEETLDNTRLPLEHEVITVAEELFEPFAGKPNRSVPLVLVLHLPLRPHVLEGARATRGSSQMTPENGGVVTFTQRMKARLFWPT